MVLIRGNTVICSIIVANTSTGVVADPATSVTCTIKNPQGTVVVNDQAMTKDDVGYYHYDYQTTSSSRKGDYEVYYTLTDGTRVTIAKDVFTLDFGI
jgi:uncharacterized protein YfaS (alpha-2-macroglobulin family)